MSTWGGRRAGAGRKKYGENRMTQEAIEKALSSGVLPLDYLLAVMRNESEDPGRRLDAAKAAAPYVHARLSAIEARVEVSDDFSARLTRARARLQPLEPGLLAPLIDALPGGSAD